MSVANKTGASAFCRVLRRTHLGFLAVAGTRALAQQQKGSGNAQGHRAGRRCPDRSARYRHSLREARAGCAKLDLCDTAMGERSNSGSCLDSLQRQLKSGNKSQSLKLSVFIVYCLLVC